MSSNFLTEYQERKNGMLAIVTMNTIEPNNTFNQNMLDELVQVMQQAGEKADILLLTSANEKFFSNGLDGAFLLQADQKTKEETVAQMIRVQSQLLALEKPWVAEITGYAMAGGAVISTAADYRYMISQGARIGFSELMVGLPLPLVYLHNIKHIVHPSATRWLMEGTAYKPQEAEQIGLVDGLADTKENLRRMCLKRIDAILRLEQQVYLVTRNNYRQSILREIKQDLENDISLAMQLTRMPAFEKALQNIAGRNKKE